MPYNFAGSSYSTDVAHQDIPFPQIEDQLVIPGDGAVTLKSGQVVLSKASAAAITIAAPDRDGQRLIVFTTTAQAHVVTCASVGFNAKGSSGTLTFTAAIGNSCSLSSYNGNWYVRAVTGVTIA